MTVRHLTIACLALAASSCQQAATEPVPAAALSGPSTTAAPAPPSARASALDPTASPFHSVEASMEKFLAARSFHARMDMEAAQPTTVEMDFVAPDRYRMVMGDATQVVIGDTMYMQVQGQTMKMPLPAGTLGNWRDPLKMRQSKEGMVVEALGSERVDGHPARKFHVRYGPPDNAEVTYWIGTDGLPLQLVNRGSGPSGAYTMTIRYSGFDDPAIAIDAPR